MPLVAPGPGPSVPASPVAPEPPPRPYSYTVTAKGAVEIRQPAFFFTLKPGDLIVVSEVARGPRVTCDPVGFQVVLKPPSHRVTA